MLPLTWPHGIVVGNMVHKWRIMENKGKKANCSINYIILIAITIRETVNARTLSDLVCHLIISQAMHFQITRSQANVRADKADEHKQP